MPCRDASSTRLEMLGAILSALLFRMQRAWGFFFAGECKPLFRSKELHAAMQPNTEFEWEGSRDRMMALARADTVAQEEANQEEAIMRRRTHRCRCRFAYTSAEIALCGSRRRTLHLSSEPAPKSGTCYSPGARPEGADWSPSLLACGLAKSDLLRDEARGPSR